MTSPGQILAGKDSKLSPSLTAAQITRQLRDARSVVFILHCQPDGDAIGSAVALAAALEGKRVRIACVNSIPPVFTQALGAIKVENILPISASLYVVLDCPDLKRTGFAEALIKIAKRRPVIVIDHHQSGDLASIANQYLSNRQASSTCEVVATVIDELRTPISPPMATALLLGIHTDTGGLQHPNTTSSTLNLVSHLIRLGANFEKIRLLFSPQRDLKKLQLWGLILSSISVNSLGITVARVSKDTLRQTGAGEEDLLGLAKYLCSVEGTKAALVLVETDKGWRGSLRTKSRTFNVGRLAKLLGGSGGRKVAGFLATEDLVSGTMLQNPRALFSKEIEIKEL